MEFHFKARSAFNKWLSFRTIFSLSLVAASFVVLLMARPAFAQVVARNYERDKNSNVFKVYVTGMGDALLWANVELQTRKQPQLYCQPPALALNQTNYLGILDREIHDRSASCPPETPVGLMLLNGLIRTFPCEPATPKS